MIFKAVPRRSSRASDSPSPGNKEPTRVARCRSGQQSACHPIGTGLSSRGPVATGLAAAIQYSVGLLACLLPLLVCIFLLYRMPADNSDQMALGELLVTELTAEHPLVLPAPLLEQPLALEDRRPLGSPPDDLSGAEDQAGEHVRDRLDNNAERFRSPRRRRRRRRPPCRPESESC